MAGISARLYPKLPVWAQNVAVTTYGAWWWWYRFGPGYAAAVNGYHERDRYSPDQWAHWQQQRLQALLGRCATTVPYYVTAWSAAQKQAAASGDLAGLPLLTKEAVRANPRAFLRQDLLVRHPQIFHTSGSTGTPIATYWTAREYRAAMALREVRSAGWAGVSFRLPRATISGRLAVPDPTSHGPFHRYNAVERQVYFSPFHLNAANAPEYVRALHRHKTQWLTGYAVSWYLLARHILDQKLALPPLKAVITTSEKLTPAMRTTMEQAYGCRIFEEYSTVENVLFASDCEHGRLHVSPDCGVVEILRPDGTPCAPGETGEVVATCLLRDYQPLIRYRLGDMAAWASQPCPCGQSMPVISEVAGRIEDVIIGPDGREMVRFHGLFVGLPHVVEGQVIQESVTHLRINIVPAPGFSDAARLEIQARVRQRLGPGVTATIVTTPGIPRTAAGKFRAVISELKQ